MCVCVFVCRHQPKRTSTPTTTSSSLSLQRSFSLGFRAEGLGFMDTYYCLLLCVSSQEPSFPLVHFSWILLGGGSEERSFNRPTTSVIRQDTDTSVSADVCCRVTYIDVFVRLPPSSNVRIRQYTLPYSIRQHVSSFFFPEYLRLSLSSEELLLHFTSGGIQRKL